MEGSLPKRKIYSSDTTSLYQSFVGTPIFHFLSKYYVTPKQAADQIRIKVTDFEIKHYKVIPCPGGSDVGLVIPYIVGFCQNPV